MSKRAGAAILLVLGLSCGDDGGAGLPADAAPGDGPAETGGYCGTRDAAAVEARITTMLAELTLDEKITLMHGTGLSPEGGVWRVAGNERLGIPGLRMLDGPRGVSAVRGLPATAFPVAMMRGATWAPALEAEVGRAMARELRSVGGNVLLAPTINLLRHPRWGRAQETYTEDVHLMGELAVAFIRGVQAEGVLASVKHFAVNSIENTRYDVDVSVDERTLREIYLPHFERAVTEAHVASVMSAYNQVNGFYCDQQAHLLAGILKSEWGFAGFVESDWILGTHGDAESVLAGLDIEMPSNLKFRGLFDALDRGALTEADIDAAVRRILRAQLCFGLDEATVVTDDPSMRETPAHLALAREVARRGQVLLRNQGVLPFGPAVTSIVVVGRNADVENIGDEGSSKVTPSEVVTALEGLGARAGVTVTHLPGTTLGPDEQATIAAADAVVVVTGLQAADEGESTIGAGDRADLAVPADEVAFVKAVAALHPAVVVVLHGGSAFVTSDWDTEVEAVLHAFYPGAQGGHALADVLFGDFAPSGRLPFSMPEAEEDLPAFDNVSVEVTYDYFHGYRHLAREATPARYPFGFGLSYTTFTYAELTLDATQLAPDGTLTAEVTVTNSGAVAGTDTVQLYVSGVGSRVERSPHDLRAFTQVTLAPGASERVTLVVDAEDLAFYDVDAAAWEVEAIDYEIRIAAHAADPGLVATIHVP